MGKKKGKLVILSAPSGCGKTTVANQLTKEPNLVRSISSTTRLPRSGEKHGIDYFFISEKEFKEKIKTRKFIEYVKYGNSLYGTPIEPLKKAISNGFFYLLVIEVKGALEIIKKLPDSISFFLIPPDMETLRKRLTGRNENTPEEIEKRIQIASEEIKHKDRYDHCIVNYDSLQTASLIKDILNKYGT